MSFNKEEYDNLTSAQIEEMAKSLAEQSKNLKKLVQERDNRLTKALYSLDLEGLKKAMAENGDKPFPEDTGAGIVFTEMKAKDIDFFLYVTSLPQFKKFETSNYNSDLTKSEEAVATSIRDKELFNFFINHPLYSTWFNKIIPEYGIDKKAHKDVIPQLFERGLLKPTEELFNKAMDAKAYNFLEYFIENNSYADINNKMHDIYFKVWNRPNESITELLKNRLPRVKDIPLNNLIKTFPIARHEPNPTLERFDTLLGHKEESYLKIMEDHPMTKDDIKTLIIAFSHTEDYPNYPQFHNFCKFIVEKKPQHINDLKNSFSKHLYKRQEFIKEFEKAILHIELTENLNPDSDKLEPKKLKI